MDEQDHESRARTRIANFVQLDAEVPKKELASSELQALESAAGRLDQLLVEHEQAEVNLLRAATSCLDQLLAQIGAGKDVSPLIARSSDEQVEHEAAE